MKPLIASFLILATSLLAQARLIRHWSDQELFDQSDLVVLATPITSADTKERTDLPGFLAQHVIGVETGFAVSVVVKGDKELKNFVLHHYRADKGTVPNGPSFIAFKPEEKRTFLLFLKRGTDGRYAPTVGQVDPGFQGIAALGDPVSATPSSPPPVDVVKATSPTSRALDEKNILAAGDWSEPVAGVPDKHTGRGAHRPIIRGRLLLCESPKNHQPAAYLELQDCGDTWGGSTEVYCDMGGFSLELNNTKGQPLPPKPSELSGGSGGGGMPGAHWMTLPCDTTVRLRISPYASFSFASTDDYFVSGTFVVDPPADHTGLDVWQGTLKLSAMKVVVPKTIPDATHVAPAATSTVLPLSQEAQAVLDGLNQKAADPAWQSEFDMIERPETRPPNQVISGEVTAFLSDSKQRLAKLGVRVCWNATSKRYEAAPEKLAQAAGMKATATIPASVKTSPQALIEAIKHRPDAVKDVYLTITGSAVNLKDGSSLQTDSIELQGDVAQAAKDAGIASYLE